MWFQPLECSRKKTHNKCKQTNIEKLNVTNVSISLSDREYVNTTSMYMETDENLNAAIVLKWLQENVVDDAFEEDTDFNLCPRCWNETSLLRICYL